MILVSNDHVVFEYNPAIRLIIVDLFSGAGGLTTGAEKAQVYGNPCCRVVAAVNHDLKAIESHKANHPNTFHFVEDIRTIEIAKLASVVDDARKAYPNALFVIWASLECTNFSKAKGGQSRDADSRTLAEHLERYLILNPDGVMIENVQEFMSWGPLDENGKPISMKEGRDYLRWVNRIKSHGFVFGNRILNSANFGAFTARSRYFAQFLRKDLVIRWPEITHAKEIQGTMFGKLKQWKAVREVLDLEDEGTSIFNRKKPLVNPTLERIYAGLVKFVANGDDTFIKKYYSGKPEGKVISINGPAGTIKTADGQALVKAVFLQKYNSMASNGDMKHTVASVDNPSPVITTQVRINVVQAFMMQYHGNGQNISIDGPASTIPTKDRLAVVKPQFLVNPQFNSKGSSINKPCFTLIARMDKRPPSLVSCSEGNSNVIINDGDPEILQKIKLFMLHYSIADIKMRMLKVSELLPIMGFPKEYILMGNQTDQKKFIGNAVETTIAKKIVEAFVMANLKHKEELMSA